MGALDRILISLLGAGVATALVAGAWSIHQHHAEGVIGLAVRSERARWQEANRQALADANAASLAETTSAAMAALEAQIELAQLRQTVAHDRLLSRDHTDSLQRTIAEFRDRAAREAQGAGPGSIAHGAAVAADALSECSRRREEVAAVADQLTVQVIGLQGYLTKVVGPMCIAGMAPVRAEEAN